MDIRLLNLFVIHKPIGKKEEKAPLNKTISDKKEIDKHTPNEMLGRSMVKHAKSTEAMRREIIDWAKQYNLTEHMEQFILSRLKDKTTPYAYKLFQAVKELEFKDPVDKIGLIGNIACADEKSSEAKIKFIEYYNEHKDEMKLFDNNFVSMLENLNDVEKFNTLKEFYETDGFPKQLIRHFMHKTPDEINSISSFFNACNKLELTGFKKPEHLDPYDINPNSLALVHMTNFYPDDGKILTTRDAIKGTRNSAHFTLNHVVEGHRWGSWDEMKYCIISPYSETKAVNSEGKFKEGTPIDIYTDGSVTIPEGSVIIKQNPDLKDGEIKFYDEKEIKGVKVLESNLYPAIAGNIFIGKLGYDNIDAVSIEDFSVFNHNLKQKLDVDGFHKLLCSWDDFSKKEGIKPMKHAASPANIPETLIESLYGLLAANVWTDGSNDYKEISLQLLSDAKEYEKLGYKLSVDIDKLVQIIKDSKTPNEAVSHIEEDLGIQSVKKNDNSPTWLSSPQRLINQAQKQKYVKRTLDYYQDIQNGKSKIEALFEDQRNDPYFL